MNLINLLAQGLSIGSPVEGGAYQTYFLPPAAQGLDMKPEDKAADDMAGAVFHGIVMPVVATALRLPELPPPADNTMYLASFLVACEAAKAGRTDVVCPGEVAFDIRSGQPICILSLRRPTGEVLQPEEFIPVPDEECDAPCDFPFTPPSTLD